MKKKSLIIISIIILMILALLILMILRGNEDSWVKDSKGIYIKHGNPSNIPQEVLEQQTAINCAMSLYAQFKSSGNEFISQCLGKCQDFSIDLVNNPRIAIDDLPGNECSDFIDKITHHVIELDKSGNIIRIV